MLLILLAIVIPNGIRFAHDHGYSPWLGGVVSGLLVCVVFAAVLGALIWKNARQDARDRAQRIAEASAPPPSTPPDPAGRIETYRSFTQLQPKNPARHVMLADLLMQTGSLDEAIASYRKALHLKPDFAHAHYQLGLALKQKGEHEEAQRELERAGDYKPRGQ